MEDPSDLSELTTREALKLLNGDCQVLQSQVEWLLVQSQRTFRLQEIYDVFPAGFQDFSSAVMSDFNPNVHLLFHGTEEENHALIAEQGFLEECFGQTDGGYIGKGVYLTPQPDYAAAYIKDNRRITPYRYNNPVRPGASFSVIACIARVGRTKRIYRRIDGTDIPEQLDSHYAWVDKKGKPTRRRNFALEYAIRDTKRVYPRFIITFKRINREVIWVDPNIMNRENSRYVSQLREINGIFLFATPDADEALDVILQQKKGTDYRVITAGRGGEDFVWRLREEDVDFKVLVFCREICDHRRWARRLPGDNKVTSASAEMIKFATWEA